MALTSIATTQMLAVKLNTTLTSLLRRFGLISRQPTSTQLNMNQFLLNDGAELIGVDTIEKIHVSTADLIILHADGTSTTYTYADAAHANQAFLNYQSTLANLTGDKTLYVMPPIVIAAALAATSLSVVTGPPGTATVLTGAGFTASSPLYIVFGAAFVSSYRVIDDTHVEVVIPQQPQGLTPGLVVDMKISYFANGAGAVGIVNAWTY